MRRAAAALLMVPLLGLSVAAAVPDVDPVAEMRTLWLATADDPLTLYMVTDAWDDQVRLVEAMCEDADNAEQPKAIMGGIWSNMSEHYDGTQFAPYKERWLKLLAASTRFLCPEHHFFLTFAADLVTERTYDWGTR